MYTFGIILQGKGGGSFHLTVDKYGKYPDNVKMLLEASIAHLAKDSLS